MKKINKKDFHQSQRGYFTGALYNEMVDNDSIFCLSGDLGFGQFDMIRVDFQDRFINTGAAEQTMLDIACGLALEGKTPFVYTITPFLLRGYETIRTYIDKEKIPVHMIGAGRDNDYGVDDGFSHDATDIKGLLDPFKNIKQHYPENKEDIPALVAKIIKTNQPSFLSLRRK